MKDGLPWPLTTKGGVTCFLPSRTIPHTFFFFTSSLQITLTEENEKSFVSRHGIIHLSSAADTSEIIKDYI